MDWMFQYLSGSITALVALLVCAGISLAAFAVLFANLLRNRQADGKLACVWNKDTIQPHDGTTRWACTRCGASSFAVGDAPPVTCRRYEPKQAA
jgi:hypothetical protein